MRAPLLVHIMTAPQTLELVGGQVDFLKAKGWQVVVIASSGPALERFAKRHAVQALAVSMPRRMTPFADWRALRRLTRLLADISPDVVHAHTPKAGFLGTLAARRARVPVVVYQMRGLLHPTSSGLRRAILRAVERSACRHADWVLCQSASLRGLAMAEKLCRDHACSVLGAGGNGIDTSHFDPSRHLAARAILRQHHSVPPDALVMGFVGRLVRDKGVVELAAAWEAVRDRFPHLHWVIVGPKETRDALPDELLQRLERDHRVHLVGLTDAMADHYSAMDFLVLPSHREGLPNSPLEAAAMGLPVVVSDAVGCVDALLPESTGIQVPVGDRDALAEAIARYCRSKTLRREHGDAGRRWVTETFKPLPIWEGQVALYNRLLERAS